MFCVHISCMLDQVRVEKIPEEYILKRYTRNARQNATFDRRDYKKTAPDGSSMFCRRRLLVETSSDLSNRGVKSDSGFNRALYGMRALIEEVDVLNEEEVENNKNERSDEKEDEHKHDVDGAAPTVEETILPPPVSNTKGRKKENKSANKKAAAKDVGSEKKNKPEPELDSEGRPLGVRMCKSCEKIVGHNSRTCKQRLEKIKAKNATTYDQADQQEDLTKRRLCSICKNREEHNARTCPQREEARNEEDEEEDDDEEEEEYGDEEEGKDEEEDEDEDNEGP